MQTGSLFRIPIFLHWSVVVLPVFGLWHAYSLHGSLEWCWECISFSMLLVLALMLAVLAHEIFHALAGRFLGIGTSRIVINGLGGAAFLDSLGEKPHETMLIAIAGPMANILIGLGVYFYLEVTHDFTFFTSGVDGLYSLPFTERLLYLFFYYNLILIIFNLIPGLPLDGGWLLEATLRYFLPGAWPTMIAARCGQLLAAGLFLLGAMMGDWVIPLIGAFILWQSSRLFLRSRMERYLSRWSVRELMGSNFQTISEQVPAVELQQQGGANGEHYFITRDEEGQLSSVHSARRVAAAIAGGLSWNTPAKTLESLPACLVETDTPLFTLWLTMTEKKVVIFPVMEGEEVVGLVEAAAVRRLLKQ